MSAALQALRNWGLGWASNAQPNSQLPRTFSYLRKFCRRMEEAKTGEAAFVYIVQPSFIENYFGFMSAQQ